MRIPLDYYQILGVAFNATSEQIQQSFEDRLQQLPKQQYSNSAIAARKKLLQEAHSILLNPKRRQEHDQNLFPNIENPLENLEPSLLDDDAEKGIDVESDLLAGALILLLEFGEFDAVLELGLQHLDREIDLDKLPTESGPADDDVALAVAIANLELGREHWQQGDCESAGNCLQSGLKILQDEDKYLDIQSEIETDLSKLRPYRVLDLLALEQDDPQRAEGLSLLQDMLDERGGLEGNGDDKSGLSVNDFLLFMQQLRDHLTVDEQFRLFHAESMRPSSVASYLSVYAHVARGISEYEPDYVGQGKTLLASLADRQDLSLEQGMCSLLLGQPEAAMNFVQQSQDQEAITYIKESSNGAPDIIPGLYLYTEQWLQHEVFPYFRDLKEETVSLEQYFNDEGVQAKLSELEPELPAVDATSEDPEVEAKWQRWLSDSTMPAAQGAEPTAANPVAKVDAQKETEFDLSQAFSESQNSETEDTSGSNWFDSMASDDSATSEEADLSDLSWGQDLKVEESPTPVKQPRVKKARPAQPRPAGASRSNVAASKSAQGQSTKPTAKKVRKPVAKRQDEQKKKWVMWGAALLLGLGVVWGALAIGKLFQPKSDTPEPEPSPTESVSESSEPSSSESTEPAETPVVEDGEPETTALTQDAAQEIIQAWQKVKADALGKEHQVNSLNQILVEPELSRWQYSANVSQDEGKYTKYELKSLVVESFELESPTVALVRAKIEETRDDFLNDSETPLASLSDSYQVDYRLELVEGKWRIQRMDVVE